MTVIDLNSKIVFDFSSWKNDKSPYEYYSILVLVFVEKYLKNSKEKYHTVNESI